ncbi:hypothetical protein GGS24DRAFT_454025 [Hypoxylon argillaceum]|nr:hypothetical protein GGS24DRAFT_454025 [Hypoxylon argillaceum]
MWVRYTLTSPCFTPWSFATPKRSYLSTSKTYFLRCKIDNSSAPPFSFGYYGWPYINNHYIPQCLRVCLITLVHLHAK